MSAALVEPAGGAAPGRRWPLRPCDHPRHDPPALIAPPADGFTHRCPGCGRETTVYPPLHTC